MKGERQREDEGYALEMKGGRQMEGEGYAVE
jgi:hypothetical protein